MAQLTKEQKRSILKKLNATAATDCAITLTQVLDTDGDWYVIEFDFDGEKSACIYCESQNIVDTLTDWQSGVYPTTVAEIPDYEWRCDNL